MPLLPWNGSRWTWERIARLNGLAAAVAVAHSCGTAPARPIPHKRKDNQCPMLLTGTTSINDLSRKLYEIAAESHRGRGGPEQYRAEQ